MSYRSLITAFFYLFTCIVGFGQEVTLQKAIAQSKTIATKQLQKNNYPGLAVGVRYGDMTLWVDAYGYADIEGKVSIDPYTTKFRIGSISKSMTAIALAQMVEAKKINLSAAIQDYVSSFPTKDYPVNVAQIAGHIGGIRHYKGMEFMSNVHYPTVESGLAIFKDDPLQSEPGEKYSYSSYGWNLISAAIESASNVPFLDYMQTKVFEAVGLENTTAEFVQKSYPNLVSFYIQQNGVNILAPPVDNSYKWAGGGFISTVDDLLTFSDAVMDNEYYSEDTKELFWTRGILTNGKKTNYGLGWAVGTDKKDRSWVGHSGGSVGGTSMLLMYPQHDLTVVTLVNQSSAKMEGLAFTIANIFIELLDK